MSVSINDLKGFDFSDKYLKVHEKFSIIKDGKQVDFKIVNSEKFHDDDIDEYWIEYEYHAAGQLIHRSQHYKNPFEIFNSVENDIVKSDDIVHKKSILIKNILEEFNPNFDRWDELTKKLSSKINILEFYPNYQSSKIPQDLSKEELAEYLDKFSKYELESFFTNISLLDFEIVYQNIWGEDYEYLIRKAFSANILGEKLFSRAIYDIINQKRQEHYIELVLKNYGFETEKYDMMVSIIYSIINSTFVHDRTFDSKFSRLQQLNRKDKISINEDYIQKMKKIDRIIRKELYNTPIPSSMKIDYDSLNNSLSKLEYVKNLEKISSNSKSDFIMRYKTPNDYGEVKSFQTAALNHGHIQIGNSKDNLSLYTTNTLRGVLKKYGLKSTGNKIHLINRIKENLSDEIVNSEFQEKYYSLTKKGQEFIDKYGYLVDITILPANFT